MMRSINKNILITQSIISFLSLLFIIILTTLDFIPHINIETHLGFSPIYISIITFIVFLFCCYFVNFIIAFFIQSKDHKLLLGIRITSWIFLLSSLNWIFIWFYFYLYKNKDDEIIRDNANLLYKLKKSFLLIIFFSSIISLFLLLIGVFGQLNWLQNQNNNTIPFLPLAFFSLIVWSTCLISIINFIVLYKFNNNQTTIIELLFLLILPSISSLILLNKNKIINIANTQ